MTTHLKHIGGSFVFIVALALATAAPVAAGLDEG